MRRGTTLRAGLGTTWPPAVAGAVRLRDRTCIGPRIGMLYACQGELGIDHVRASHGMGMKSESTVANGALLCFVHHRIKTEAGREWRPLILDWIARHPTPEPADCGHVDPRFDCDSCQTRMVPA